MRRVKFVSILICSLIFLLGFPVAAQANEFTDEFTDLFAEDAPADTANDSGLPVIKSVDAYVTIEEEEIKITVEYEGENTTANDVGYVEMSIISGDVKDFVAKIDGIELPLTVSESELKTDVEILFPEAFQPGSTIKWTLEYSVFNNLKESKNNFSATVFLPRMPWSLEGMDTASKEQQELKIMINTFLPEGDTFIQSIPVIPAVNNEALSKQAAGEVVSWEMGSMLSRYEIIYGQEKSLFTTGNIVNVILIFAFVATLFVVFISMRRHGKKDR